MENSNIANENPMLNKSFMTTNKIPLFVAGVLIFASFGAWAKCAIPTLLDSAPLGYCHNEYGQIEADTETTNAILGGILGGGSKQKTTPPTPVKIDPTENVTAPFEGTQEYIFENSAGCKRFNLIDHKLSITIEPLRSGKVHLVVHEINPDKSVDQVYDGFLININNDVGFTANNINTLILREQLFVELSDGANIAQCVATERVTRNKKSIKGFFDLVDKFIKH